MLLLSKAAQSLERSKYDGQKGIVFPSEEVRQQCQVLGLILCCSKYNV